MEYFLKNKIIILRVAGILMLVIGFAVHFWVTPKEVISQNDRAAANVARMEAQAKGKNSKTEKKSSQQDNSKFLDSLKNTQAKQMEYLTIFSMIFGISFLGYTFLPKREEEIIK